MERISDFQLFIGDFKKELFVQVKNDSYRNKPSGGLWTSNFDKSIGSKWLSWSYRVLNGRYDLNTSGIIFKINKENLRIYYIRNRQDLLQLYNTYGYDLILNWERNSPLLNVKNISSEFRKYLILPLKKGLINFESISIEYDAIHLTEEGNSINHLPFDNYLDLDMNGWDVESTLWFNFSHLEIYKAIKLKKYFLKIKREEGKWYNKFKKLLLK